MTDIIERLRALSAYKHDDFSIGDEAADTIESLRAMAVKLQSALAEKHDAWTAETQNAVELEAKAAMDEAIIAGDGALITGLKEEIAALKEAIKRQGEPAVWMQSTHLDKFINNSCGADSMLARCSIRQLQPDYRPLYTSAQTIPEDEAPILYICTECGGANYGCTCDSLEHCTVPLYVAPQPGAKE